MASLSLAGTMAAATKPPDPPDRRVVFVRCIPPEQVDQHGALLAHFLSTNFGPVLGVKMVFPAIETVWSRYCAIARFASASAAAMAVSECPFNPKRRNAFSIIYSTNQTQHLWDPNAPARTASPLRSPSPVLASQPVRGNVSYSTVASGRSAVASPPSSSTSLAASQPLWCALPDPVQTNPLVTDGYVAVDLRPEFLGADNDSWRRALTMMSAPLDISRAAAAVIFPDVGDAWPCIARSSSFIDSSNNPVVRLTFGVKFATRKLQPRFSVNNARFTASWVTSERPDLTVFYKLTTSGMPFHMLFSDAFATSLRAIKHVHPVRILAPFNASRGRDTMHLHGDLVVEMAAAETAPHATHTINVPLSESVEAVVKLCLTRLEQGPTHVSLLTAAELKRLQAPPPDDPPVGRAKAKAAGADGGTAAKKDADGGKGPVAAAGPPPVVGSAPAHDGVSGAGGDKGPGVAVGPPPAADHASPAADSAPPTADHAPPAADSASPAADSASAAAVAAAATAPAPSVDGAPTTASTPGAEGGNLPSDAAAPATASGERDGAVPAVPDTVAPAPLAAATTSVTVAVSTPAVSAAAPEAVAAHEGTSLGAALAPPAADGGKAGKSKQAPLVSITTPLAPADTSPKTSKAAPIRTDPPMDASLHVSATRAGPASGTRSRASNTPPPVAAAAPPAAAVSGDTSRSDSL